MSSLEYGVPLDTESVFEAGSISKEFTAAAVLLLVRDGRISLDDPVRRYLPELPQSASAVRVRHLLNHTSGIRDWELIAAYSSWPEFDAVYTNARALDFLARQKGLNNPPGEEFIYSNSNFTLAALIVERVSGKTLGEFTRERIFKPLNMTHTEWRDDYARLVPHRATPYEPVRQSGGYRLRLPLENGYGPGGLLTTVGDLSIWNNAMMRRTLGPSIAEAMERHPTLTSGRQGPYGFGLFVGAFRGAREMLHDGSTAGYKAFVSYYPDDSLSIALLCNIRSAQPANLGRAVASVFLTPRTSSPAAPATDARPMPRAALETAVGLYRNVFTNDLVELAARDAGWHVARGSIAGATELEAVSPDHFVLSSGARGELSRDQTGRVVAIQSDTSVERPFRFERVKPWRPGTPLSDFVGDYATGEVPGTTYSIRLDSGALRLTVNPDNSGRLTPAYEDALTMNYLGTIRFGRDRSGRVTTLTVSSFAARNIVFSRMERREP